MGLGALLDYSIPLFLKPEFPPSLSPRIFPGALQGGQDVGRALWGICFAILSDFFAHRVVFLPHCLCWAFGDHACRDLGRTAESRESSEWGGADLTLVISGLNVLCTSHLTSEPMFLWNKMKTMVFKYRIVTRLTFNAIIYIKHQHNAVIATVC